MKKWYQRKKISSKNQIGLAILLGVIFALMGFLGSYSASFLWYWQQTHPKYLYVSGFVAIVAFLWLVSPLINTAKKYL